MASTVFVFRKLQTLMNSPPREVYQSVKGPHHHLIPPPPQICSLLTANWLPFVLLFRFSGLTFIPRLSRNWCASSTWCHCHLTFKHSFKNLLCSKSLIDYAHILHSSSLPEHLYRVLNHARKMARSPVYIGKKRLGFIRPVVI